MLTLAHPHVRAEGIAWPLETFLDTHGFERRPDVSECRHRYEGAVEIVDDRFELHREVEARHVDWHSVVAVKAGAKVCEDCGLSFDPDVDPIYATRLVYNPEGRLIRSECAVYAVNAHLVDYCERCRDYAQWIC